MKSCSTQPNSLCGSATFLNFSCSKPNLDKGTTYAPIGEDCHPQLDTDATDFNLLH